MGSIISCNGVSGAPHVIGSCFTIWHVPLRAWRQESSREAPQGVRPGRGGAIDGATIHPRCHQVDLHLFLFCFFRLLHFRKKKSRVTQCKVPPKLLEFLTYCSHSPMVSGRCSVAKTLTNMLFHIDKSQQSAPVCEGYWGSGRTHGPMVLSGREAGLFQWQ